MSFINKQFSHRGPQVDGAKLKGETGPVTTFDPVEDTGETRVRTETITSLVHPVTGPT